MRFWTKVFILTSAFIGLAIYMAKSLDMDTYQPTPVLRCYPDGTYSSAWVQYYRRQNP